MSDESFEHKKILLIYVEPTPYIVGLIRQINQQFAGQVDVLFLKENASQHWDLALDNQWMLFPAGFVNQMRFIRQLLRAQRYDVVHIAGWGEPIFLYGILLVKWYGMAVTIESDTPMPPHTKAWKRFLKRLFYPRLFRLVNLFLPGGKRQAAYLAYFGIPEERIIPVQMTVDVASIQQYSAHWQAQDSIRIRQMHGLGMDDIVFLYVGRLEPHKGIIDLINAFQAIQHPGIRLLFVGDGMLRDLVEKTAQENQRIHYAGRLTATDLMDMYFAADVVVLPSHFEPWGLVINEAMAAGKPVIVSNRVGCIDDLVTMETGLIVKAGEVTDLRDAMLSLAQSAEKRLRMGQQAKQAIAAWTLENEAGNICKAWQTLIKI